MKKFKAFAPALATLLVLAVGLIFLPFFPAHAQGPQGSFNAFIVGYTAASDPCQNPTVTKSSVAIAVTSATTTKLVTLASGKKVYVCGLHASLTGTTPSILFESGGSTTCTSPTSLTGAIQPTSGSMVNLDSGTVQFTGASGAALCVVTGGTVTFFEGYLVYLQQ